MTSVKVKTKRMANQKTPAAAATRIRGDEWPNPMKITTTNVDFNRRNDKASYHVEAAKRHMGNR